MADDMTLKWDATNSELYAEDSNGNRIPVPFDSIDTDDLDIGDTDLVSTGDFHAIGPTLTPIQRRGSTSNSSYSILNQVQMFITWDRWLPSGATGALQWQLDVESNQGDYRIRNQTDGETLDEQTNLSVGQHDFAPTDYTPTTTSAPIKIAIQAKNDNNNTTQAEGPVIQFGVQY